MTQFGVSLVDVDSAGLSEDGEALFVYFQTEKGDLVLAHIPLDILYRCCALIGEDGTPVRYLPISLLH